MSRAVSVLGSMDTDLGRRMLGLALLPLRPATARAVLERASDAAEDDAGLTAPVSHRSLDRLFEVDPGWAIARHATSRPPAALEVVAETTWWSAAPAKPSALLERLWRNSVATALAARGLARDAGDRDPDEIARAGLLARLGWWAAAVVDPAWLENWSRVSSTEARRRLEIADLGLELCEIGRRLAVCWGCSRLVVDAAWLHADTRPEFLAAAAEPDRLLLVQRGVRIAEETPWALEDASREGMPSDPRGRILVAEVQARCTGSFIAGDASSFEERTTRRCARLRLELAVERPARGRAMCLLNAMAQAPADVVPDEWAPWAALALCEQEGVHAAQVDWLAESHDHDESPRVAERNHSLGVVPAPPAAKDERPPSFETMLFVHGRPRAVVKLWCDPRSAVLGEWTIGPTRSAWEHWATLVHDKSAVERRLQTVASGFRSANESEQTRLARLKYEALAEFAAGAGHELNNPLAVIMGRAQILLSSGPAPDAARSLRLIVEQAARAHRMLRDLMFIARPPAPRLRECRAAESLRNAARDLAGEIKAKDLRLVAEYDESEPVVSSDPDALDHLAVSLLRNAIEATPPGGVIEVRSSAGTEEIVWHFADSGRGFTTAEAARLLDPFYCGRQAGRGLGLGLPRAARITESLGARLRWSSNPGSGALFLVHLPIQNAARLA